MIETIPFYKLSHREKKRVLEWRNDVNIRKWMKNKEIIGEEEHFSFIESLRRSDDKDYRVVKQDSTYLGVINLINITETDAELGLYKNPVLYNETGIGSILMESLFELGKFHDLNRLYLYVDVGNEKALNLYIKHKFQSVRKVDNYIYMERDLNVVS